MKQLLRNSLNLFVNLLLVSRLCRARHSQLSCTLARDTVHWSIINTHTAVSGYNLRVPEQTLTMFNGMTHKKEQFNSKIFHLKTGTPAAAQVEVTNRCGSNDWKPQ